MFRNLMRVHAGEHEGVESAEFIPPNDCIPVNHLYFAPSFWHAGTVGLWKGPKGHCSPQQPATLTVLAAHENASVLLASTLGYFADITCPLEAHFACKRHWHVGGTPLCHIDDNMESI
jgi:hypothetical protein